MRRSRTTIICILLVCLPAIVFTCLSLQAADKEHSGYQKVYSFDHAEHQAEWMHITSGEGNGFDEVGAHLAAGRGRSFLLNIKPQPVNVLIEAKTFTKTGPAFAWILARWQDANNFYEIVLKEGQVEVWRKYNGKYIPILKKKQIKLDNLSAPHILKAKIVGQVPAFTVWVDDVMVWSGREKTGLPAAKGRFVALETEHSSVVVTSVSIAAEQ